MKKYSSPDIIIVQCTQDVITTSLGFDAEQNARDDVAGFETVFGSQWSS
jgi:hypothetical protein